MTDLQVLAIAELVPHPDNPRLQLREDVIERIAAEIGRHGFGREHALLVRPDGGGHQILSGHHRLESAKRAGLTEVPCWVKDLDDDEAFMQLVLANTQGELSPLEVGMHALNFRRGGQAEYAERLGLTKGWISQVRSAAEVASKFTQVNFDLRPQLIDKAKHLYEISRAPVDMWSVLVDALVSDDWTVADSKHHVDKVREFDVPAQWRFWLNEDDVARRYLKTREFSPRTVSRLISAADQVVAWVSANSNDADKDAAVFRQWLVDAEVREPRSVAEYLSRLIAEQFIVKGWHQGNWRQHLAALDDGSVALLLTDPPYGQAFQSDYRLDRRVPLKHELIAADDASAPDELLELLEAIGPKLADNAHLLIFCGWANEPVMREVVIKAGYTLRGSLIWDKNGTGMGDPDTTFAPAHERILHAVKGSPILFRRAPDLLSCRRCDSARHPTEKPVPLLRELIEATTADGQLVADPFGGVGSTLVAAKDSGRRWWGCELEEGYWALGEERLS